MSNLDSSALVSQATQLPNSIRIVGLSTIITDPFSPQAIGNLWQQAGAAGVLRQDGSPNYGVYFNYEAKQPGGYHILVGSESDQPLQPGQAEILIPSGSYQVFQTEGPVPAITQQLWQHIWGKWPMQSQRNFQCDFERYLGNPEFSKLELFVGTK
jgi:predicted transcriptional regulator YdeE